MSVRPECSEEAVPLPEQTLKPELPSNKLHDISGTNVVIVKLLITQIINSL